MSLRKLFQSPAPKLHIALNGDQNWWRNGQRHRDDGPAVEYASGRKEWYRNGMPITAEEIAAIQERLRPQVSPPAPKASLCLKFKL